MYGLEKKPTAVMEFDLEKDLKKDSSKLQSLMKSTEHKIQEIKGTLKHGSTGEEFDQLGVLLHGYMALQRVLNRFGRKK